MALSLSQKIEQLWTVSYQNALGAGESDPFAYADQKVAPLRATLRAVEHRQAHPLGLPRVGCRAGRGR